MTSASSTDCLSSSPYSTSCPPSTNGCLLGGYDQMLNTTTTTPNSYSSITNSIVPLYHSSPDYNYSVQPPPSCSSYNSYMPAVHESKIPVPDMMSSVPHSSPPSYYSPPATMQVPVEGTISTTDCHYNYYTYGVSPSPSSHPHTSPLSSHHSASPIMRGSPPIHTSVASIHSPLM
jgi:hypothetical protein